MSSTQLELPAPRDAPGKRQQDATQVGRMIKSGGRQPQSTCACRDERPLRSPAGTRKMHFAMPGLIVIGFASTLFMLVVAPRPRHGTPNAVEAVDPAS
jgi:hypothetical protein